MAELRELLQVRGPFASVALDTPSATEDARDQFHIRWTNARRRLEELDYPPEELGRLEEAMAELHHGGGAAVVVLQGPGLPPFIQYLDDPIGDDLVAVAELPRLGPVLESRQRSVPHLLVLTDRTGADLIGVESGSEPELVEVAGDEQHIQRSKPGGWSQRRFQQRAENQWESNAGEVAEEVAEMARRLDARLIAIAGDVRAVGFLVEQLPADVVEIAHVLDGQSEDLIADETSRAVADVVARETRSVLERFREADGQGRAAAGPHDTLGALAEGRVDTLLVHDDPDDERQAYFDPDGMWCASAAGAQATVPPDSEVSTGRLIDVAIRVALLGDSTVRFVPRNGGPPESLGALLRW
jgi:peptide subunit release factor 1 (eRF1)